MSLFGKHGKDDAKAGSEHSGLADDLIHPGESPHAGAPGSTAAGGAAGAPGTAYDDRQRAEPVREDAPASSRSAGRGDDAMTVSEERLAVGTQSVEAGSVRARKHVDVEQVSQVVPRGVEHADMERAPASEGDSGQVETLPDGSISIPVFEEQIVVEKRLVVRERVVLRKHTVYEEHEVTADLRRERLEVETDGDARVTDERPGRGV